MKKNIIVKQEEVSDCGVCCLLSIIRYYGGNNNLEELRIETQTNSYGVAAYNLIECAKNIGFDAKGIKTNRIDNIILPCIAHLKINQSLSHFVVIYKYESGYVTIMDPAKGLVKLHIKEFKEQFNNIVILLMPQETLTYHNVENVFHKIFIKGIKHNKTILFSIILLDFIIILLSILFNTYIKVINFYEYKTILFMFYLLIILLEYFIMNIINKNTQKLIKNIKNYCLSNYFIHIFKLPLKYLHNKPKGEILRRIEELEIITEIECQSKITSSISFISLITICIISFIVNLQITLFLIITSIVYYLFIILTYKNINMKLNSNIIISTQYNNKINDYINGLDSIIHCKVQENIFLDYKEILYKKSTNNQALNNYNNNITNKKLSLKNIILIFIYYYLIKLVINKNLLIENLVIYISIINIYFDYFDNLTNLIPSLKYKKSIINKINDFYNLEERKTENNILNSYNIKIKNLSFYYNKFNPLLKIDNLEINESEKVIIKGRNGVGKSTLCKLLTKEYEDYKGNILIDNQEVKDLSYDSIINNINYSSQNEKIFRDTIINNILLGRTISDNKLNTIIRLCKIDNIIKNKPFGLETYLYGGGSELSGGERQMIILARSLIKNFNILILDETLSEVNEVLEEEIIKNIIDYYKDKTIIYITHKSTKEYPYREIYV